jgi:hypothetical protein
MLSISLLVLVLILGLLQQYHWCCNGLLSTGTSLVTQISSIDQFKEHLQHNTFPGALIWHGDSVATDNHEQKWWMTSDPPSSLSQLEKHLQFSAPTFDQSVSIPREINETEVSRLICKLFPDDWSTSTSQEVAQLLNHMQCLATAMQRSIICGCSDNDMHHNHQTSQELVCRLALLQRVRCPKWHCDNVSHRLLVTYFGPGTDWCDPNDAMIRIGN